MGIKNISEVIRRDIFTLFREGYVDTSPLGMDTKIFYPYYGCLTELEFLRKLYPLAKMPSTDSRFFNAEDDIWQHTMNNEDWEYGWIFSDARFELQEGEDRILLKFLCAVFHPAYRREDGYWKEYLSKIQTLLRPDGYELYVSEFISGRALYDWRILTDSEKNSRMFLPFSQRYKMYKLQLPSINLLKRRALKDLMRRREENEYLTSETGYNYCLPTCKAVIEDVKTYYSPMAYNTNGQYKDEEDFDKLLLGTAPKNVFDLIELYARYQSQDFEREVNVILADLNYKLLDGKIMSVHRQEIRAEIPKEPDLRELIQMAERHYAKDDIESKQLALEKIWDAFEKLKTYYSTDKKRSVTTIINKISAGDLVLQKQLDAEFKELGKMGNEYRIRHFETGKLPIADIRVKEYWYTRCLALINLAIKFIEEN